MSRLLPLVLVAYVALPLPGCGGGDATLLDPAFTEPPGSGGGAPLAAALPSALNLSSEWRLEEAFPGLGFDDPVALVAAPRTDYLFVAEREGKLYAFENYPEQDDKILALDLSGQNQGENDSGLLGIAFHPDFGKPDSERGRYVYLHYAFSSDPIVGATPPFFTRTRSRLARFEVDLETMVVDPQSELVLIDQQDENVWHQGGALFFHPRDGFLYLAVGDEGNSNCSLGNCQRIDKDLFSGVLRIDVDQRGGEISHPIVRQPQTGVTANYYIPNDNPFVGQPSVLEEFYALGLRSPHRMTHDPVDDVVWIGDVGGTSREEINILARGANYQWNVYEGTLRSQGAEPDSRIGVWTGPLLELGNRNEARSITGGYVYRGERLPELFGKYIFADFVSGWLWSLEYELLSGQVVAGELTPLLRSGFRDRENGITSFGIDRAGELYVLTLGAQSKIQRLARSTPEINVPLTLSEIGVFGEGRPAQTPNRSLLSYSVQSPLWSDGAVKRRWISLPEGTDAKVGFSEEGPWRFPEGTVLVKHFEMARDERRPRELTALETRLLVIGEGGRPYGVTYKWNEAGTEARLVTEAEVQTLEITQDNGESRTQEYFYPGPTDCSICHNAEAAYVLGVRTAQLNGPQQGVERSENQLLAWSDLGLFDEVISEGGVSEDAFEAGSIDEYPRLVPLSDVSRPPEERLRSYWDANCSMCHGVRSRIRAEWDARIVTPLSEQRIVSAQSLNGGTHGAALLVEPGAPEQSVLYQRGTTLSPSLRMPPLGTQRRDEGYLELLRSWIESLAVEEGAEPPPSGRTPAPRG